MDKRASVNFPLSPGLKDNIELSPRDDRRRLLAFTDGTTDVHEDDQGLPSLKALGQAFDSAEEQKLEAGEGRVTGRLFISLMVSLFGSFQFGWHTGVVNLIKPSVTKGLDLSTVEWAITVGIFSVGGAIGAFGIPRVLDKLGRKWGLTLNSLTFVLTGILQFISGQLDSKERVAFIVLLVSRVIAGIGSGAATVAVPMYLGEIASINLRGLFGSFANFSTVCGIFVSQAVSIGLRDNDEWKWLLSITGFLGLIQFVLGFWLLESPKWLANRGDTDEAHEVLLTSRGYEGFEAQAEMDEIMLKGGESLEKTPTIYRVVTSQKLRRPLVAAVLLTVTQQMSGIDAVFYYSGEFFEQAGTSAVAGTLMASATNIISMGVGVYLMEKTGRRSLLLSGTFGMSMSALLIVLAMVLNKQVEGGHVFTKAMGIVVILFVLCFVSSFQIGLGSIPWQIGGEIFPDAPRATAMSIAAASNWIASATVAVLFPIMLKYMGELTFLPFAVLLFLSWLYSYYFVPGTKGRTLAEIQDAFHGRAPLAAPKLKAGKTFPPSPEEQTEDEYEEEHPVKTDIEKHRTHDTADLKNLAI